MIILSSLVQNKNRTTVEKTAVKTNPFTAGFSTNQGKNDFQRQLVRRPDGENHSYKCTL
jgi:hypothetical protein